MYLIRPAVARTAPGVALVVILLVFPGLISPQKRPAFIAFNKAFQRAVVIFGLYSIALLPGSKNTIYL